MFVLTESSATNAASASSVLEYAIPSRNRTSSRDPTTMNGLRRPQRVTAKSLM